jgi:1-acyl-sn-glycerol-3-phosphate acyltransferase
MHDTSGNTIDWRSHKTWYTHETRFLKTMRALVRLTLGRLTNVITTGFENLPDGPCILASNHLSIADVIFMAALPRHPFYMAKVELFKNPLLGWSIRQWGAFPVYRGDADNWVFEHATKILAADKMLAVFPEGHRSKNGQLLRGKSGTVRLVLRHQVPVVPMAIWGTERLLAKGGTWLRRPIVNLAVGPALDLAAMAPEPPYTPRVYRNLTTVVMKAIARLLPETYRGTYA